MKRAINFNISGSHAIRKLELCETGNIDPILQKVLTLMFFSVEDYTKTQEGLSIIDTLHIANTGDLQAVAALFTEPLNNIKNAINNASDEVLIDQLYISMSGEGGKVQAIVHIDKTDKTINEIQVL